MSGGNIRVICRLRPENKVERESGGYCCVEYAPTTIKIRTPGEKGKAEDVHSFTFDHAFGPETSQKDVFQAAAGPVVNGVLSGYNGTLFAYGQTGSGKTHTMEGPNINDQEMKGIIPRMMDALFVGLVNASAATEFCIKVSFLEIYMERMQDLLDASRSNLQVKEDRSRGIYVQDATELYVSSPAEMMAVMQTGSANRSVAATRMNERSSRSHSIFIVQIEQKDIDTGTRRNGKLYFVDLAGSEKVGKTNVSGQQLEEAKMINKSLSALGMVINALTERQSFVPYRDSKLTRLLQESLGGNAQTTLVIACSMSSYNAVETLGTLRFGQRAKKIQNKPILNQERSAKELLVKLEQAEREIQQQAEVLSHLQSHLQRKYAHVPSLMQDVAGIVANTAVQEAPEVKHEPAASTESSSAQSLTLLKQHIEIVNLHEELQRVKLEKQEIETELTFRSREVQSLQQQNADMERSCSSQVIEAQARLEEMQGCLDKALMENLTRVSEVHRVSNAVARLNSDLNLVDKDILGFRETSSSLDILKQSISETISVLSELQRCSPLFEQFPTEGDSSLSMSFSSQRCMTLTDMPDSPRSEMPDGSSTDRNCHRNSLISLQTELELEKSQLEAKYATKRAKHRRLKTTLEEVTSELGKAQIEASKAEKLAVEIRRSEELRSIVSADMVRKDQEIAGLHIALSREKEKLRQIVSVDDSKRRIRELEDRNEGLQGEMRKLYEEIVALRKLIDCKEEETKNWRHKFERLERNLGALTQRSSKQAEAKVITQTTAPMPTSNIVKPIRGGGGDVWSFRKNNQEMPVETPRVPQQKLISRISKIQESRSGFQAMLGGFFSNLI